MHVVIVCSEIDDASQNVARHLLKRAPWVRCSDEHALWTYGDFKLFLTKGRLVKQEALDREVKANLLIFASRHQSETRKGPVFTAHFSGVIQSSDGVSRLARAAPRALKLMVEKLKCLSDIEVLIEVTHHGPCAIDTPSLFVEIGSTKSEWNNEALGDVLAQAILSLDSVSLNSQCVTAVGFGGSHYALRHTDVLLHSDICYGHIFAQYQLRSLSPMIIMEAFERSQAQFAYFDRKQMGGERDRLVAIVNHLGYDVLRKSEIELHGDVSWRVYLLIRRLLKKHGVELDGIRIYVSSSLRDSIAKCSLPENGFGLYNVGINLAITKLARAVDDESFKCLLENEEIVYLERKDGDIRAIFVSNEPKVQDVRNALLFGCVEILKKRYEVEYSQRKSKLYISERKFNARLARSLGVADGPLFAKLARGESISINSKVIKPEDVFTKVKKAFDITNADELIQR